MHSELVLFTAGGVKAARKGGRENHASQPLTVKARPNGGLDETAKE